jgi:hypothetical protein
VRTGRPPGKKYEFEGAMMTLSEIRKRVPRLDNGSIKMHLEQGRCTAQAMLTYNPRAAQRAGALKGKKNGWARQPAPFLRKRPT